jgi:hypothetical protein
MIDLSEVALDCRPVQGDSALEANRIQKQIEEEIQRFSTNRLKSTKNRTRIGPDKRGEEHPDELQDEQDRLDPLREAKENSTRRNNRSRTDRSRKPDNESKRRPKLASYTRKRKRT